MEIIGHLHEFLAKFIHSFIHSWPSTLARGRVPSIHTTPNGTVKDKVTTQMEFNLRVKHSASCFIEGYRKLMLTTSLRGRYHFLKLWWNMYNIDSITFNMFNCTGQWHGVLYPVVQPSPRSISRTSTSQTETPYPSNMNYLCLYKFHSSGYLTWVKSQDICPFLSGAFHLSYFQGLPMS